MFNHGKSRERTIVHKNRGNQENLNLRINIFHSNNFLHTQSHIQLNVKITKVYPFAYYSVLCIPYEAQLCVL